MDDNRIEKIVENKKLNQRIVYAINKAVVQDVPQDMREHRLETNNRNIFSTGDHINNNLRQYVVSDNVNLIPFNRFAWEGRIIVDSENKVTYTICTHQNLKNIIKKHRNRPHYLMALLYVENGDCRGCPKQMTLGDFNPQFKMDNFEGKLLEEDFDNIMHGSIKCTDGFKHYIVAYTTEHHVIKEIEVLLLDKDFEEVDRLDLIGYITPDFASLAENQYEKIEQTEAIGANERKKLLKLKQGVKPAIIG